MPPIPNRPRWASPCRRAAVYQGDCLSVMAKMAPGSVDLVFADPPFNVNWHYDVYNDNLEGNEYCDWTFRWLSAVRRVISEYGTLWVAINPAWQAEVKVAARRAGFHWRDTVVWHYTFGPAQQGKFTPSWVALHYLTAHRGKFTWNPEPIRVPSARQLKYKDRRAFGAGKVPDNVWVLLPEEVKGEGVCFAPNDNCWLHSRVCGTFDERTRHPCQMPLTVLGRIIRATSNEGDVVFDPFLGSGTTAEAAVRADRKAVGVELSPAYVDEIIIPRLELVTTTHHPSGRPAAAQPPHPTRPGAR